MPLLYGDDQNYRVIVKQADVGTSMNLDGLYTIYLRPI